MPDISMCLNEDCPRKYGCYRYCAIPSPYQSVCRFEPRDGECDGFERILPQDRLRDLSRPAFPLRGGGEQGKIPPTTPQNSKTTR